jgi:hypothetical protein
VIDKVWLIRILPNPLTTSSVPMITSVLMPGVVMLTAGPDGVGSGVGIRVAKTGVDDGIGVGVGLGVRVGGIGGVRVAARVGMAAVGMRVGSSGSAWQPFRNNTSPIRTKKGILCFK